GSAVLRSVSALTAYHWVYRESVNPWLIADLLILRDEMPRSLASCYENLVVYLDHIARAYGRQGLAQRHARAVRARLENSRMDEIFQQGMHEFISKFIDDNNRLGAAITEKYMMKAERWRRADGQTAAGLGLAHAIRYALRRTPSVSAHAYPHLASNQLPLRDARDQRDPDAAVDPPQPRRPIRGALAHRRLHGLPSRPTRGCLRQYHPRVHRRGAIQ